MAEETVCLTHRGCFWWATVLEELLAASSKQSQAPTVLPALQGYLNSALVSGARLPVRGVGLPIAASCTHCWCCWPTEWPLQSYFVGSQRSFSLPCFWAMQTPQATANDTREWHTHEYWSRIHGSDPLITSPMKFTGWTCAILSQHVLLHSVVVKILLRKEEMWVLPWASWEKAERKTW